jgi:hypothetical protein
LSRAVSRFRTALDGTVDAVGQAIVAIEAGDFPDRELHYLRQHLLDTLAIVERDPGIEAAVADLYAAATALAIAQTRTRGPRHDREERTAHDAFLRLRRRLSAAIPNEATRDLDVA